MIRLAQLLLCQLNDSLSNWLSTSATFPFNWNCTPITSSDSVFKPRQHISYAVKVSPSAWFTGWVTDLLIPPYPSRKSDLVLKCLPRSGLLSCNSPEEAQINYGRNVEIRFDIILNITESYFGRWTTDSGCGSLRTHIIMFIIIWIFYILGMVLLMAHLVHVSWYD